MTTVAEPCIICDFHFNKRIITLFGSAVILIDARTPESILSGACTYLRFLIAGFVHVHV